MLLKAPYGIAFCQCGYRALPGARQAQGKVCLRYRQDTGKRHFANNRRQACLHLASAYYVVTMWLRVAYLVYSCYLAKNYV
jgi:hypothetical protein